MPHSVIRLPNINEAEEGGLAQQTTSLNHFGQSEYLFGTAALRSEATLLRHKHILLLTPLQQTGLQHSRIHLPSNGEEGDGPIVERLPLVSVLV